jgi:superfamily II DNA or RNA helicase
VNVRAFITVGPVWARLEAAPDVRTAVREALAVDDPAARHTRAFKSGRWDGRVQFIKRANGEFLSGLTWRVSSTLVSLGHPKPEIRWPALAASTPLGEKLRGMEWRTYQLEAADKWARARRMVLQCPTRGGKTEIAIEGVRRAGGKTLWVTHTDELIRQTPARFADRLGLACSVVQGKERDSDSQVVVGMVQTLSRMLEADGPEWFQQFDVLVMDECHHAGADTWQAVAAACSRANLRLGLSGSVGDEVVRLPLVTRLKIEGALGPTFTVATTMGLADLGFVAAPTIVALRCPSTTYPSYEEVREAVCPNWRSDPQGLLSRLGASLFREMYERGVMRNDARNALVIGTAVRHAGADDRFLVLCNRVPHAEALYQAVRRRVPLACPVFMLSGEDDSDVRAAALAAFKDAGRGAVLVCTPFFREGVDVPQIDAGFLAGGGESDIAVIQALGRMLTVRPGKTEVLIYDVEDGRDPSHLKDYLSNHWKSRLALYKKSGFNVERR